MGNKVKVSIIQSVVIETNIVKLVCYLHFILIFEKGSIWVEDEPKKWIFF